MRETLDAATKRGTSAAEIPIPGVEDSPLLPSASSTPSVSRCGSSLSLAGRPSTSETDTADPSSPSSAKSHTPMESVEMLNRLMRIRRLAYRRAVYLQALSVDLQDAEVMIAIEDLFDES